MDWFSADPIRTFEHMTTITTPRARTEWIDLAREVGAALQSTTAERDRTGAVPADVFNDLRRNGVSAALVPADFGGGGASHADMGAILRELGRWDPAVAVTLSMHSHLVATQVWRHNHGMDASKLFERVAGGALLVSTGASDWVSANGRSRKVEGGFRVDARKPSSSGSEIGDIAVTSIHWAEGPDGPQVIHCAIPLTAEGVSVEQTWDTMGMRATGSHTIVFDDVFVPDGAVSLIRPADRWHPVWNIVLGAAMPLISAAYLGVADAAVEEAVTRSPGRTHGHVIQLLGEMRNAHTIATDVVHAMFVDSDDLHFANTDEHAAHTLSRKTVAAEAMITAVRLALEAVGGSAYSRRSPIERLYRDIHGVLFHPLPRARQTEFTGRVMVGLSPV